MIGLIIAGGSGTRLWPLSTPDNPKQMLKLYGELTMIETTIELANNFCEKVFIVANDALCAKFKTMGLEEKYTNLEFIIEPAKRGTMNCIIFALAALNNQKIDKNLPIAILSADHFIQGTEEFTNDFRLAGKISLEKNEIVLLGARPNYPSTGFGYIKLGDEISKGAYQVVEFKEKPDLETAKKYLKSSEFLWNCGYFVGSINAFVKNLEQYNNDAHNSFIQLTESDRSKQKEIFASLENESIDVGLIEKLKDLAVVPATFNWLDLGTFPDYEKIYTKDKDNNVIVGSKIVTEETNNCFIINKTEEKLICIGLTNSIVVADNNGIVVSNRDQINKVGELSKQ